MDAAAHLRAQGWQGPGNGLRAGSLQRAILTSKKTDLKGLGAKVDESDQWWDNIFSKQLSNITVGAQGAIAQVNGGIQAAHPIAARSAHRKQFGEKSALEKVFILSEVLKGSEVFIPLATATVAPISEKGSKQESGRTKNTDDKKKKNKHSPGRTKSSNASDLAESLPSPPPSPVIQPVDTTSEKQMSKLSDKTIRKEARRLRRETRALERAAKEARREKRRLKKLQKISKAT